MSTPGAAGLVVVDKPAGMTSHDVVARVRRIAGTRRVGHAGTLDPAATGVLLVGVGRATRVLGHLAAADKGYEATVRLGETTVTDDAEGEVTARVAAGHVAESEVRKAAAALTGRIAQVPSSVSAVKVGGRRSYARVRAGEAVQLEPRQVVVHALDVHRVVAVDEVCDVDVSVTCSTGTYVRALARDLGAALEVGGHLVRLRRTRVGPYAVADARSLDDVERDFFVRPLADVVAASFPRRDVSADEARRVAHGGRLQAVGLGPGPVGVFAPDGTVLALVEESAGVARPLAVFTG